MNLNLGLRFKKRLSSLRIFFEICGFMCSVFPDYYLETSSDSASKLILRRVNGALIKRLWMQ